MFIVNAVLVFLLLNKFLKRNLAFVLSLIFLVHPINQDASAYISNLQDVMFFFFGMLTILISTSKSSKYLDIKVFLMLIFSLLSKETGIAFFLINLGYIFIFKRERFKKQFILSAIIIVIYGIIHTLVVGTSFITQHIYHIARLPLLERLINIPKIIFYYLFTFVYPRNLAVSYDWVVKSINSWDFYWPLLIVLLFFGTLFLIGKSLRKKQDLFKVYIFFVLWFILGLLPHIQIVPLDGAVAPRWFYLPIVGLLAIIGIIYQEQIKGKKIKIIFLLFSVLIILLFSMRTVIRNTDFKDNLTLMCHDASASYDNFALENSCGASLFSSNLYDQAQTHLERSVALAPYYGINWWTLGMILGRKAELYQNKDLYNKSVVAFKNGIRTVPYVPWSYETLGYLYAHYEDPQTAKKFLVSSLNKFPNSYVLWLNYAYVEYKLGDKKMALRAITNAHILNPNDSQTTQYYYNMSNNLPIKIEQGKL